MQLLSRSRPVVKNGSCREAALVMSSTIGLFIFCSDICLVLLLQGFET